MINALCNYNLYLVHVGVSDLYLVVGLIREVLFRLILVLYVLETDFSVSKKNERIRNLPLALVVDDWYIDKINGLKRRRRRRTE